ncbi:MAG: hypothetical protein KIC94_12805 [Clostridiales bacterium]|nr:hypothetical protein [Clostridiales bacterium]
MTKQESIDSLKKILGDKYGFSSKTTESIYRRSEELMGHIWKPNDMHNAIILCIEENKWLIPWFKKIGGSVLELKILVPRYLW